MGFTLLAPLWNLMSLFLIITGLLFVWLRRKSAVSQFALSILLVFLNQKMCDYSYVAFIPYGIGLLLLASKDFFCNKSNGRLPTLLLCSGLGLSIIYITLILCYFIASLVIPSEQFSLAEARKRFDESHAGKALVKGLGSVGFPAMSTPSMVVLGDAGSAFVSFNPSLSPSVDDKSLEEYESKTSRSVKYLIYPQTETLLNPSPPTTLYIGNARFTIDQSFWVSPSIADMVLRPASLTNRYNFAIYKRSIHFS